MLLTFTNDFKKAVAQTLQDDHQVDFSWSGRNSVEARKEAGKELAELIKEKLPQLQEGEKVTIIGHSHGGNVIKEASHYLNQEELDNIVFLAIPHRSDFTFNPKSLKQGGKVVNVYGSKDLLLQQFFGSGLGVLILDFAKQTMQNATNIQINQGSRSLGTDQNISPHTVHTRQNWKNSIDPILRKR